MVSIGIGLRLAWRRHGVDDFPDWSSTLDDYEAWSPAVDTRHVYCSSSLGNDANDGLSEDTPKATLAAALTLLRTGFPDVLYLLRGDTWTDQQFGSWTKSGRSGTERMVVTTYGTTTDPRPVIRCASGQSGLGIYSDVAARSHLLFEGFEMLPNVRSGTPSGMLISSLGGTNITVQDVKLSGFATSLQVQGRSHGKQTGVLIHRNVLVDNYGGIGGLLCSDVDGLTITGNILDRNGWTDATFSVGSGMDRNCYIQSSCDNVVCDDNWSVRSASNGFQLRAGGNARRNVVVESSQGIRYGSTNSTSSYPYPGDAVGPYVGVTGACSYNLCEALNDLLTATPAADAGGIELAFCAGVTAVENITHLYTSTVGDGYGLQINGQNTAPSVDPQTQPITDLTVTGHISYAVDRPLMIWGVSAGGAEITGTSISGSAFHSLQTDNSGRVVHALDAIDTTHITLTNNRYSTARASGQWFRDGSTDRDLASWQAVVEATALGTVPAFLDPGRTIADFYDYAFGTSGTTREDVYAALRNQRRHAWDPRLEARNVIDYVRAGYGLGPTPA